MKKKYIVVIATFTAVTLLVETSHSHVTGSTSMKDGAPHWHTIPYDLRYDAKWVNLSNSSVELNSKDELIVSGQGDFSSNKAYGIQFSTSEEWEEFISGHKVKVTVTTRSSSKTAMRYKIAYMTNSDGFSGWHQGIANLADTTFSFEYRVPEATVLKRDFVVLVPELQNTDLIVVDAVLELMSE